MKEQLEQLVYATREATSYIDRVPTVNEFLQTVKDASFDDVNSAFISLALDDLQSYFKNLFQFIDQDFSFKGDIREDIKNCVNYVNDNFGSIVENLDTIIAYKIGIQANGNTINIGSIVNDIIAKIIASAKIINRSFDRRS